MAGSWNDVPGRRMVHHKDGTILLRFVEKTATPGPAGSATEYTQTVTHDALTDHKTGNISNFGAGSTPGTFIACFIFPQLRDIDGFYWSAHIESTDTIAISTSADTTNGVDGTWVNHFNLNSGTNTIADVSGPVIPGYRSAEIESVTYTGKRSIAFILTENSSTDALYHQEIHIYGKISSGETPDRLIFIDEGTSLEFTKPKDYGDVPRGSARDFDFRVKNNSTTGGNNLTANGVAIATKDYFLGSNSWYTYDDGGTGGFQASLTIGNLAPQADSGVITARQIVDETDPPGIHAAWIEATTTSWS